MILVLADHYLPGVKAGGPIRTLSSLVARLGDEFAFWVLTRDRDFGDAQPYDDLVPGTWLTVGKARVQYVAETSMTRGLLARAVKESNARAMYLNSFFSLRFAILPVLYARLRLLPAVSIILAPRGEFSPGALRLKRIKKRCFLLLGKASGLYRDVVWQASSDHEVRDIRREFGHHARIVVAPNLAMPSDSAISAERSPKQAGVLRIVFLSRVSRKKNLDGALSMLRGLHGRVSLDIYGPVEDASYWQECQDAIRTLPSNVAVHYGGMVAHSDVGRIFRAHDLFLFPTLGENFGHVILEALTAGCPVMISDRTPWRNLKQMEVGWDIPLDQPALFERALAECVEMGDELHRRMSTCASAFAQARMEDPEIVEQNRRLLRTAIARAGGSIP